MSARRILSVPVSDELDKAVHWAAQAQRVTVAAWARSRLLNALRRPQQRARAPRASLLSPFGLIPRAWSIREAAALLGVTLSTLRRKIHAGQLPGYQQSQTVYDPGRGRYLRRRRWMIPGPALFAWMEEQSKYVREHGLCPYSRRVVDTSREGLVTRRASSATEGMSVCG